MTLKVLDTFAWIEYFAGSKQGEKVRPYIERGEALTPSIVVAEFTDKYVREGMNLKDRLAFIRVAPLANWFTSGESCGPPFRGTIARTWG